MTENKRFTEIISTQKVIDNQTGMEYNCLIDDELLELLNKLNDEKEQLKEKLKSINQDHEDHLADFYADYDRLEKENEHYKAIFFEVVETALNDKNCRELYCKGILNIFDKANSLNHAKYIIKEHLK